MDNNYRPLVTIAIPTYNRADGYLREALESALSQTYEKIEIVVSDNCSMDNTESVVRSFSDSRIQYFRQPTNIGANNNFNFCVQVAKGEYFLLLHDDDLIDHDFIDVCLRKANYATNYGIIRTGTRIINGKGYVVEEFPNNVGGLSTVEFFRGWFAGKTVLYLCSTLFNTKGLKEIGGFKSKHNLFQDVVAEVQLAARFGRVDIRDVKASFRKHDMEMTFSVKVSMWCEDSLELLELMCDLVSDRQDIIRDEGFHFFARLNYGRARAVRPTVQRMIAYLIVFRMFKYKYLPPIFLFSLRNPVYRMLRSVKRSMG